MDGMRTVICMSIRHCFLHLGNNVILSDPISSYETAWIFTHGTLDISDFLFMVTAVSCDSPVMTIFSFTCSVSKPDPFWQYDTHKWYPMQEHMYNANLFEVLRPDGLQG